ncbi:hypothetical protein M404DRAFT_737015 [Pisolithus tinctorius Marx 270]|uniref:Uncharacterized protein n=1 Tax=Pisolithus tinctorius Marx 270 TaxID=870435 RepID=A0A0C3JUS3_PISTI|nr:hypothetical protein M404DRAFT_737015 [Pisolithus tinctorius Marx 270]
MVRVREKNGVFDSSGVSSMDALIVAAGVSTLQPPMGYRRISDKSGGHSACGQCCSNRRQSLSSQPALVYKQLAEKNRTRVKYNFSSNKHLVAVGGIERNGPCGRVHRLVTRPLSHTPARIQGTVQPTKAESLTHIISHLHTSYRKVNSVHHISASVNRFFTIVSVKIP